MKNSATNNNKLTAEESCRQVLKTLADACDQEALARAGGYLFWYLQEETVLRDCGQRGVCRTPPSCARHWEERNRELVSENASLASQVESMALRIDSLAEELAKPEEVRLREVLDALEGRAVFFDGLGARVGHLLDEMDKWIGRAGAAERLAEERLAHANQRLGACARCARQRTTEAQTKTDSPPKETRAQILRRRILARVSQQQLGDYLGLTKQAVSLFEKGKRPWPPNRVKKALEFLRSWPAPGDLVDPRRS